MALYTVALPFGVLDRVDAEAARHHQSRSQIIRQALLEWDGVFSVRLPRRRRYEAENRRVISFHINTEALLMYLLPRGAMITGSVYSALLQWLLWHEGESVPTRAVLPEELRQQLADVSQLPGAARDYERSLLAPVWDAFPDTVEGVTQSNEARHRRYLLLEKARAFSKLSGPVTQPEAVPLPTLPTTNDVTDDQVL